MEIELSTCRVINRVDNGKKEYPMLTQFKEDIRVYEAEFDKVGYLHTTETYRLNHANLKDEIERLSYINCNNAKSFKFKY